LTAQVLYLSQLLERTVLDPRGLPLGHLGDLVVGLDGPYPPVIGLTLRLGGGRGVGPLSAFMHWDQVSSVSARAIVLASTRLDLEHFHRRPRELLLRTDLLDQQVIDVSGRKLVRVNDVQLVTLGAKGLGLRLAGVDVGGLGLLRRLGMERPAAWVGRRIAGRQLDRVVPWRDIEPIDLAELPGEAARIPVSDGDRAAAPPIRLAHAKLAAMHASEVAELVAMLSARERTAVLESLETEFAAETMGELEPDMRGDVLEDLPKDSAIQILAELPPDEAADALAEVSEELADELLEGLEPDDAEDVRSLMSYPDETAGAMMSTSFVALPSSLTAEQTIVELRRLAPPADEIYYVYLVGESGVLDGVVSLRDLIVAEPTQRIGSVAGERGPVITIPVSAHQDEVVDAIDKYNLLALPVVDEEQRLVGVVTVDDALAEALPPRRHWLRGVGR
jgi:CBS domain-containing protein/sporulation protein YlmC with PRC-barrel domain